MDSKAKTILRQLQQLSQVEPASEAAERAMATARATLAGLAAKPVSGAGVPPAEDAAETAAPLDTVAPLDTAAPLDAAAPRSITLRYLRSKPMFSRATKLVSIAVVLVVIVLAYLLSGGRPQLAFAEVAEKVQKTQSLSFKTKTVPADDDEDMRALILPDGTMRTENSKVYSIQNIKARKMIMVMKDSKTARIFEDYSPPSPTPADFNLYELIKNVRKEEVQRLPDEKIDGRGTIVFRAEIKQLPLPEKMQAWKVWVDPKTELPIRIEQTAEVEPGKSMTFVMYDIEFDRPFDPELFSFTPPAGYTVQTSGVANFPDLPDKPDLRAPKIIPGAGLGPIRFGMSREQIESLLGKPDGYEADKTCLLYFSRGFVLTVSHRSGLKTIDCVSQMLSLNKVRDFAGKTAEGIGIGSSLKDVEKAFGKPDRDEGHDAMNKRLVYDKLGLEIQFVEDKVITIFLREVQSRPDAAASGASKPGEKTIAAELRTMQINVVGPDGKPMPGANIHVAIWSPKPAKTNKDHLADDRGQVVVEFPQDFKILRFWAYRDGYVPLFVHWEELDEKPPQVFTVKLAKGTIIGGTVQDEQGRPIAGAKVEVSVTHDPADQQKRMCISGWLSNGDDARTTDAAGRWTLDNVPDGDVKLSLKVSHAGYLDYESWDAAHQKETCSLPDLRSQKATTTLRPKK